MWDDVLFYNYITNYIFVNCNEGYLKFGLYLEILVSYYRKIPKISASKYKPP